MLHVANNGLAVMREDALEFAVIEWDSREPGWVNNYAREVETTSKRPLQYGDYLLKNKFNQVQRFNADLIHELYYLCDNLALPRDDVIEFVRFDGMNTPYPDWFDDMVSCGMLQDEFESFIFYEHDGEVAVSIGDVFLYRNGNVKFMYSWEFSRYFYEVI